MQTWHFFPLLQMPLSKISTEFSDAMSAKLTMYLTTTTLTELTKQGWSVLDHFLAPEIIQQLAQECRQQHAAGQLRVAGVGRAQFVVDKTVRGDQIRWLETGMAACTDTYLKAMDQLRHLLNEQLFLGLQSSENHFALYEAGAFYQKHLDRFRDEDSRVLSSVLYLNSGWQPEQGGELRLHLDTQHLDIAPLANRLVLFVSADIWHEVLPTKVERLSLTGWLKR